LEEVDVSERTTNASFAARRGRLAAGALAGGLLVLAAAPAAAPAQSAATQRAIDSAVRGIGGERALQRLSSFRLEASGQTFIWDEGPTPGDALSPASTFRVTLSYDLRRRGDRLRGDYVRTSVGADREVSEVIAGRRGYIAGEDANFAPASTKAMTSDRWAAILREQRLLNPHLILRDVLRRPRLARAGGSTRINGRAQRILVVRDDVAPIRLFVDRRNGRITRLTTLDHNYNRGDVLVAVDYRGWRGAGRGVRFPRTVRLAEDGQVLHTETRSEVRANARLAGSLFRFPAGVSPTFDRSLANRGARTTEWLMTFAHLGFIKDGPGTQITPVEVAPGSTLIQGHPNQSMIIEQQDGIVVAEAALADYRAEALIAYIRSRFPGKPIRYITGSHHHADHSGGMRPFVALGARPVVHQNAAEFFEDVFAVRGSRLMPDRLDRSNVQASILPVPPTGPVTLADPLRPVIVLPEATDHATTTILVYVPREGVLFVNGDTYTPGATPGAGARSLDATIRANNLTVNWIAGGHGGVISYADFQRALAQAP
jgi:glyoxylase-like metal-dependent hydrolase (beta-lactamase superfamily II)